ncbi:MAG: MBOAT family protein [Rhizobiales bacterium]|nr:MBOAT family protein [Hyphomicrobiales bacterium]
MLFPTLDFALFFVLVFSASWALMERASLRKLVLLAASYVFYAWWDWRFLGLLAASSLINYTAGAILVRTASERARSWVVGFAVVLNLAILGFFKYYGFFMESLGRALTHFGLERDLPMLEIVLPVGISFFTFQGISYVVDVARRDVKAVRSPLDLFLYISFFPQLVAGPIVRAAHFLPQLERPARLSRERLAFGLVLVLSGLFKKMVVANYLASEIVDEAFFDPSARGGIDLALGVYAYAVQIYCDFSGYSEIGIGTAALLGYHFHANFNQPYRAASLQEFWRRWHISLSEWLRDYLYKPLGGSRHGAFATYRNLFLTMLLGGLWHGANWTFVVWGLIHGGALAFERMLRAMVSRPAPVLSVADAGTTAHAGEPPASPLSRLVGILVTFHIVCFAWVFFRSPDFATATAYLEGLQRLDAPIELATPFVVTLVAGALVCQFLPASIVERMSLLLSRLGFIGLGLVAGIGIWLIEVIGPEGVAPFIYFQF